MESTLDWRLCGNVSQRTAAVARWKHIRIRAAEFSAAGGMSTEELAACLRTAVDEAVTQMKSPSADDLNRRVTGEDLRFYRAPQAVTGENRYRREPWQPRLKLQFE
jgi:hypothetical protein